MSIRKEVNVLGRRGGRERGARKEGSSREREVPGEKPVEKTPYYL